MLAAISTERRADSDVKVSNHPQASMPQAARTVQETGLPMSFLVELISKILFIRGQLKLAELSSHIKLNVSVLSLVMDFLRVEKLCDITRRGGSGTDADLSYKLTELGQARAAEFRRNNAYAGPAPVPLAQYCVQVAAQSLAQLNILHADVEREFADIVVDAAVMDQLGSALNSHRAMLIYGPSGSGKTYLAESLGKLLSGNIFVPYAILAHGEVLQIYDPFVHQPAPTMAPAADLLARPNRHDERWLLCKRPAITAGRELTLAMLDLQFDPALRYYQAPLHLKANNGIFIIDDLGMHACSVTELMDHWSAPFQRHVDHVSLHTGQKFPIPFDVIVIFTSNMQPEHLGDDSCLRRLGNRIHLGPLNESQYERIFRQVCEQYDIAYSSDAFRYLLHECHYKNGRALLACHPRDILTQLHDLARYQDRPVCLDPKSLDQAWTSCFNWS